MCVFNSFAFDVRMYFNFFSMFRGGVCNDLIFNAPVPDRCLPFAFLESDHRIRSI